MYVCMFILHCLAVVHICMCTPLQSKVVCVCVSVERLMRMRQAHFACIQKVQGRSFYDFATH